MRYACIATFAAALLAPASFGSDAAPGGQSPEALAILRSRIVRDIGAGKEIATFVRFGRLNGKASIIGANDDRVTVRASGVEVPMEWSRLGARTTAHAARRCVVDSDVEGLLALIELNVAIQERKGAEDAFARLARSGDRAAIDCGRLMLDLVGHNGAAGEGDHAKQEKEKKGARSSNLPLWNPEKAPWMANAKQLYVAPDGTPSNPGTRGAPWDIDTAFDSAPAGSVVWIRKGTYGRGGNTRIKIKASGSEGRPVVFRAYPGERATIDGGIVEAGQYVYLWGLEITNSSLERKGESNRPGGFNMTKRGQRCINCIVHDVGHAAVGFWIHVGDGGEINGTLFWANGIYSEKKGFGTRGSAIYAQNKDGTRYIKDTIAFRNFTCGQKASSHGVAYTDGFHYEGNVSFDHPWWNMLIYTKMKEHPISRLKMLSNFIYRRPGDSGKSDLQLGYFNNPNHDVEFCDNYFVLGGADRNLYFRNFENVTAKRNVIVGARQLLRWEVGADGSKTWDENVYAGGGRFKLGKETVSFAEWQAKTGFDAKSRYVAGRPGGTEVRVRPNEYEPGRGHVIIYNWAKAASVPVDVSSIVPEGVEYEIRDAQNYYGKPVAKGTYAGGTVSIPMNLTVVAQPVGEVPHIQKRFRHTAPEFGVFVVTAGPAMLDASKDAAGER